MYPAYLVLLIASVFAMAVSISTHRYLGLCAIAAGGAGVNYFLMDPVYSFRVSQTEDIAVLSLYGILGMLVSLRREKAFRYPGGWIKRARLRFGSRRRAVPLDSYHFGVLARLCAEISKTSDASVDPGKILSVALLRLQQKVDAEGTHEILEDVRLQLAYEQWIESKLADEFDDSLGEDRF